MKAFLITTGSLFGLMTVVHVWRAIAEWPGPGAGPGFVLGMTALIVVPAVFSGWAWRCLYKLSDDKARRRNDEVQKKDSDDSAA